MKNPVQKTPGLPISTKLFYGVGDTGNAVVNSAVQFFLMLFYTDVALVSPALVASALVIGKIWDAVNDPLFGWFSDRVRSKLGRRRALMIYGAIPLGFATMLLWFVPRNLPSAALFAWIAGTFILWDTLWTATNVPYYALTAELTTDYDERASLTAFRMLFAIPAFIVGAALTPAIAAMFGSRRLGYAVVGVSYGILAATALLVCASQIRERPVTERKTSGTTPRHDFANALRNRPFLQLITAYGICNLAFALTKTLIAYLVIYQLGMGNRISLIMSMMLVSAGAFLFPWKSISLRLDKGPSYAIGLSIGALAVATMFFLPAKPTFTIYIIALVAGAGFSTNWVFPWAMIPDVIEYDQVRTNEQLTGVYYGLWGMVYKLSEGLGIAVTGWILQYYHYVPNARQSAHTLFGIRLFVGLVPAALFLLSLPLLIWYPITRCHHRKLCESLESADNVSATLPL